MGGEGSINAPGKSPQGKEGDPVPAWHRYQVDSKLSELQACGDRVPFLTLRSFEGTKFRPRLEHDWLLVSQFEVRSVLVSLSQARDKLKASSEQVALTCSELHNETSHCARRRVLIECRIIENRCV